MIVDFGTGAAATMAPTALARSHEFAAKPRNGRKPHRKQWQVRRLRNVARRGPQPRYRRKIVDAVDAREIDRRIRGDVVLDHFGVSAARDIEIAEPVRDDAVVLIERRSGR